MSQQSDTPKMGTLYAIVLYDFQAEKGDELTSYAGENLFICAHHNFEWFIAKPIGRLGGPGLVPVGFVSIIDITTGYATGNDVTYDINFVNLPTVQEWKNNIARYKASNISLGSVEHTQPSSAPALQQQQIQPQLQPKYKSFAMDLDVVTRAAVESFGMEDEKYWFEVTCALSSGKGRRLKRCYQDFYDLQVRLLDAFPAESGKLRNPNGQWTRRIMPYIPGPVPYVTDTITKKRKDDLNVYVGDLITLPDYISRSEMVLLLFQIRDNGFDHEFPLIMGENFPDDINRGEDTMLTNPMNALGVPKEDNTLTGEDLKLYGKLSELSLSNSKTQARPPSQLPPPIKPTKIKFYYKDDIFALMLNANITCAELRSKIAPRVDAEDFKLFVNLTDEDTKEISTDEEIAEVIHAKLKISVQDA